MPIDDEPWVVEIRQSLRDVADDTPSEAEGMRNSIVTAAVNLAFPLIGSAVTGLLTGIATQRWQARVTELFQLFAQQIQTLASEIASPAYYETEEFQALLFEAIDQERTNRHGLKRKMLADGLARSGTQDFSQDGDKETFFRILRDLSPSDLQLLNDLSTTRFPLSSDSRVIWPTVADRELSSGSDRAAYSRLQGLGLISLRSKLPSPDLSNPRGLQTQGEFNQFLARFLSTEPDIIAKTTDFGVRFLKFMLESPI